MMNRIAIPRFRFLRHISGKRVFSTGQCTIQRPKTVEDIPGPRFLPGVGSLLDLLLHKDSLYKAYLTLSRERVEEFGKIYREKYGSIVAEVHIADPKDAELVLRAENSYDYPVRHNEIPVFEHFWKTFNRNRGVFFLNGFEWYKYRSSLSKQILVPRSIARLAPTMNEISSEFVRRVKTLRIPEDSETSYEVEDIDHELFKWSFESVAFSIFGKRFGSIGDTTGPKVHQFIESIGKFLGAVVPTIFLPPQFYNYYQTKSYKTFVSSYDKMYQFAQYFINQELQELEKSEGMSCKNGHEANLVRYLSEKKFSKEELVVGIIDLLFAGVDTTSNTMQWALYELANNPDKQAVLFDEITSTLPDQHFVSHDDLQKLPYLKAVVKETLRLHPILSVLHRILQADLVLSGYKVPTGTQVSILAYAMGHDPSLFVAPEKFLPERWLRSDENSDIHAFSSLPFGFGRRMCLGRRLAELEMHILLVHLLLNFHLDYPEDEVMEPIFRGTVIPEKPVRVKFIERNH